MTRDLYRFVASEMLLKRKVIVSRLQKTLSVLISFSLQYGIPMERISSPRLSYHAECATALAAEEALLGALYACALVTRRVSNIISLSFSRPASTLPFSFLPTLT